MALLFLVVFRQKELQKIIIWYNMQYALAQALFFLSFFCFNFYKVIFIFSLMSQLVICESVWLCLALYDLFNV
jgi:hypothetical protein